MNTDFHQSNDYLPVRRINQACLSCRLRKCRCTGDRPTCGHCRRLKIDCIYPGRNINARRPRAENGSASQKTSDPTSDEVIDRLAAIETTLHNFGRQLDSISRHLAPKANAHSITGDCENIVLNRSKKRKNVHTIITQPDSGSDTEANPIDVDEGYIPNGALLAVVDAYFQSCHNHPYSFFHEGIFRQRLSQRTIPEHLLLAVMASAVRFCSHPYFEGNPYEKSVEYANRAWKSVVSNFFTVGNHAEVSIVQTIALLGLFDFTAGKSRHGSAWVKIGMAVRIAQDCGLMLDSISQLPLSEQEEQRRVFWSIYLLDRLVSCGRGRPPAILDASCLLQLPCDELAWREGLWSKTVTLDETLNRTGPSTDQQGTFAQVIVMAHVLGRSAQYMLQKFNIRSPYPPWDPSSDFAAVESDLLHLETRFELQRPIWQVLTPHITEDQVVDVQSVGPLLFSRALFHLCYCLLNHPFLLRRRIKSCQGSAPSSFLTRAFESSWQHAQQMLELIRDARGQGCVFQSSFSGYCVTVAGSIAAIQAQGGAQGARTKARALVHESIAFLKDVGHYWPNVSGMAFTLQHVDSNSAGIGDLCNSQLLIEELSPMDQEIMWSVVDYSTMSKETPADSTRNSNLDDGLRFDSWVDLFDTTNDSYDVGFDMGSFGIADSSQYH